MKPETKDSKSMNMNSLILAIVAAILLVVAFFMGRDLPLTGLLVGGRTLWQNLPILLLGFAIAGLAQVLIPKEFISRWLGAESGFRGVLIGCVVGGLVPGAPYAIFPLVGAFYKAGAGMGAVVGFVSAWALWSVSRLPIEMALIEPKAALVRYGVTFVVPPIAGLVANALAPIL
jgi:uncharacterized membrane protein YraQ (UPF0718 family)